MAFASRIKVGSAVRGRVSLILWLGGKPRFSLAGGEDAAPDMIEDIEFETEWPGRTVEEESLETIDRGRGMNSTSSEKPTLVFLGALLGSTLAIEPASTPAD